MYVVVHVASIMLSFEKIANFVLFAKSPCNPSSAPISVAVVVKPWFEAEKMFSFFYEINNFSQTGVFLNQTHHPLLLLQLLFANNLKFFK